MRATIPVVALVSLATVGSASLAAAAALMGARAGGADADAVVGRRARNAPVSRPRGLAPAGTRRVTRVAWATALPAVVVQNRNSGVSTPVRLYADDGSLDDAALRAFMRTAATPGNHDVSEPLPARLVQLVLRASYHFGGKRVLVVSATRKGAHGKHGAGEAIDFALDDVRAPRLAAWLRQTTPRAGVGIYTHPRTQYVHLDVRDQSFHWLDGSPPGVTWRERRLPDPKQAKRDEAWSERADLPEAAAAP